jgi:MFS family permease
MILERLNARRWLARISVSFGIFATLMALVHTYAQVIIVRLLLGLAEAGLFPGVVFYLTRWFTPQERAQRLAWIFAAQPISGLLGGLLAYPILSKMDGLLGLAGWRWLFFLEGFPTILLGITAWNILPADPSEASWLSSEEQRFLTERMRGVGAHGEILEVAETDEADNSNNNDDTSMVAYSPSSRAAAVPSHGIVRRDSSSTNSSTGLINGQTSEGALSVDVDAADGDGEAAQEQQLQQRQSSPSSSSAVLLPTFSVVSPSSWRARLERSWCAARAEALSLWQSTFSNRVIYLCILSNFLILIPVQAITFFLPAIVSELGVGTLAANGFSAIPYSAAVVAMALVSLHSDRTQERVWHVIGCNVLGFISMGVTASLLGGSSLAASAKGALIFLQLLFLSLTAAGVWACKPALMALFTSVLRGNHAVAIAAITTAGNISGLITPPIMAALRSGSEDYSSGCFFLMTVLFAASIMVLALQREIKRSERLAALQLQQNSMGTLDSSLTASAAAAALDGSGVDEEEGILEQQHNPDYGATNFASAAVAATGSSDSTTDEDVSSGRGRAVLRNPAATASSRGQARV